MLVSPSSIGLLWKYVTSVRLLILSNVTRYLRKERIKHNGSPPPEIRLVVGMWGAVLIPISLFWLAFTTYPHVHWIVPIIGASFYLFGIFFNFQSVLIYLSTAYPAYAT